MLENESFLAGILGGKNVGTPITLNSLAKLYREQGKYAEAEALSQHSLAIQEQALGPDNPVIAWTVDDLAELYWDQGKYAEAEALYQRSLAIREQTLETSSQHTLRRWAVARG